MGKIEAICVAAMKGGKKKPQPSVHFIENYGIEGDAHAGPWHRQVSLLASEDIETVCRGGLPDLQAGDFAENLILSGVDLSVLGLGSRLRLGSDVEIVVTQLGKSCHQRCAIYYQTGDCIMPRLGLFARVTHGGTVAVGDTVQVIEAVPRQKFQAVILTISDRCSRGEAEDTAGPAVRRLIETKLDARVYTAEIIPDDRDRISERLRHYGDGHSIDLIVTVGGTGFAPSDVTPEAVAEVVERPTPGLDEAMRRASLERTPAAVLSRAVSGIRNATLILSLPGSERAALENLEAILTALPHGLAKLRGDPSDCGRPTSSRDV